MGSSAARALRRLVRLGLLVPLAHALLFLAWIAGLYVGLFLAAAEWLDEATALFISDRFVGHGFWRMHRDADIERARELKELDRQGVHVAGYCTCEVCSPHEGN